MKKTLLLVFIHGFKGGDQTFQNFPQDLRALLQHTLPSLQVLSAVYPAYETRGDLGECVARFTEWLQNQVLDLEVANDSRSPTLRPSVHVVLCGHSMGGIVAAEALLKVARDHPVPNILGDVGPGRNNTTATTTAADETSTAQPSSTDEGNNNNPPQLFFPHIRAVLAFDTPFLGISPGVLAHGAEEHINTASSAYKAFDSATSLFGWGATSSGARAPIPNAATRGLPAAAAADATTTTNSASASSGWGKWSRYAAVGGAAAALAGAAGAAYLGRGQLSAGIAWAGSHLEFVGCLARGAELQRRVERVVALGRSHGVGFADYYTALGEKVAGRTRYAGAVLGGEDRTFCVVPRTQRGGGGGPAGIEGWDSAGESASSDSRAEQQRKVEDRQIRDFAADPARSKGLWVKCVNEVAGDEVSAHTAMFTPAENADYHVMLPKARDQIVEWIDPAWYEGAGDGAVREEGEEFTAAWQGDAAPSGPESEAWGRE